MTIQNYAINFKGGYNADDFKDIEMMFKKRDMNAKIRDYKKRVEQDTFTCNGSHKRTRKNKVNLPALLIALATGTGLFTGVGMIQGNRESTKTDNEPISIVQNIEETATQSINESPNSQTEVIITEAEQEIKREEEILEAVNAIKNDPELSKLYYNMIVTIQRVGDCIENPVQTIQEILSEPWVEGLDIELVLPQIFYESSGQHYDENGEINTSGAGCVGLMQISDAAQTELNNKYFSQNPKDRFNPKDNLTLGIGLTQLLLNDYFPDDLFNSLCAYNAGQNNILKGNYKGSDKYTEKILNCRELLKENPKYTQMLLAGDLDQYINEFVY